MKYLVAFFVLAVAATASAGIVGLGLGLGAHGVIQSTGSIATPHAAVVGPSVAAPVPVAGPAVITGASVTPTLGVAGLGGWAGGLGGWAGGLGGWAGGHGGVILG